MSEDLGNMEVVGLGVDLQKFQDDVNKAISQLSQGADQMAKSLQSAVQKIEGTFQQAKLDKEADKLAQAEKRAADAAKKAADDIKAAWGTIGIAIVSAFMEANKAATEHEAEIVKLSRVTGLSVESSSKLAYASQSLGTQTESLSRGMSMLSRRLVQAETDGGKTEKVFDTLGIKIKDNNGRFLAADQVLYNISDRFRSMKGGIEKTGLVMTMFGKNSTDMLKILNAGSDKLKEYANNAEKLGLVMKDTDAYNKYINSVRQLQLTWQGFQMQMAEAVRPVLEAINNLLTNLIQAFDSLSPSTRKIILDFSALAGILFTVYGGMAAISKIAGMLGLEKIGSAVATLLPKLGLIGLAIAAVTITIATAHDIWSKNYFDIRDSTSAFVDNVVNHWKRMWNAGVVFWKGIADLLINFKDVIMHPFDGEKYRQEMLKTWKNVQSDYKKYLSEDDDLNKSLYLGALDSGKNMVKNFINGIKGVANDYKNTWNSLFSAPSIQLPNMPNLNGEGGPDLDFGKNKQTPYEIQKQKYNEQVAKEEAEAAARGEELSSARRLEIYEQFMGSYNAITDQFMSKVEMTNQERVDFEQGWASLAVASNKEVAEAAQKKAEQDKKNLEEQVKAFRDSLAEQQTALEDELTKEKGENDQYYQDRIAGYQKILEYVKEERDKGVASAKDIKSAQEDVNRSMLDYINYLNDINNIIEDREQKHQDAMYNLEKQRINQEEQNGEISKNEAIKRMMEIEQARYEMQKNQLQQRANDAYGAGDIKSYEQYISQMEELDDEYAANFEQNAAQMQNTQFSVMNLMHQTWQGFVNNMQSLFLQGLNAMLSGTLTWKSAIQGIWGALKNAIVNFVDGIVNNWVQSLLVKKEKSAIENRSEMAAGAAAANASVAMNATATEATLNMLMSMANAIAGIYPVGPAIAASMYAGIAGAQGTLAAATGTATAAISSIAAGASAASFDVGSWSIPTDMLAMVHKNEMIVPANFADKARALASGDQSSVGNTYHFSIQAVDAKSVERLFLENGSSIVQSLANQHRSFAV